MPNHFEMFNRFIRSQVEMTDAELESFNQKCEVVEFPKGALIIKVGEPQQNLYFITKGIVKNFIETDSGETKIYNFRTEGMQVNGYASYNYKDNLKALVNVRCIEDCIMIQVPFSTIKYVIEHIKSGERLGRLMAESHIVQMLNYIIEGHTDNKAFKKNAFNDNWSLSVNRATAVARILQTKYKIDPKRIIAAGRSEYIPMNDNNTKAGRSNNRRIRIVIMPSMKQLMNLNN